jgi:hypothetical protein
MVTVSDGMIARRGDETDGILLQIGATHLASTTWSAIGLLQLPSYLGGLLQLAVALILCSRHHTYQMQCSIIPQ